MSTFSGNIGPEEEDGGGRDGLVESAAERRERIADEKRTADLRTMQRGFSAALRWLYGPVHKDVSAGKAQGCNLDPAYLNDFADIMAAKRLIEGKKP